MTKEESKPDSLCLQQGGHWKGKYSEIFLPGIEPNPGCSVGKAEPETKRTVSLSAHTSVSNQTSSPSRRGSTAPYTTPTPSPLIPLGLRESSEQMVNMKGG